MNVFGKQGVSPCGAPTGRDAPSPGFKQKESVEQRLEKVFRWAEGRPPRRARDRPFDLAQDRPFDLAQDRPEALSYVEQASRLFSFAKCSAIITVLALLSLSSHLDANVLNNYEQEAISKRDYFCLDELNYKGRVLTIIWDRSGEKYGRGKGLTILVDGKKVAHSQKLEHLTAALK